MNIKVVYSGHYRDKFGIDRYLLNGYHPEIKRMIASQGTVDLAALHRTIDQENPDTQWRAFVSHGNFLQYYLKHRGVDDTVLVEAVVNDGSIYVYPIEICYALESLLEQYSLKLNGVEYQYSLLDLIEPAILKGVQQGWIKLLLNSIHDPLEHEDCLNKFEQYLIDNSIDPANVILVGGNKFDRYFEKHPEARLKITSGYIIPNQIEDRVKEFDSVVGSLGYKSSIVTEQDLDAAQLRPKKFICLNRNLHRAHRWVMAYFAVKYNLLDNSIFSFLVRHGADSDKIKNTIGHYLGPGDYDSAAEKIDKLVPYEIDTYGVENKNGFTLNNNKKDFYANTYINIVTETSFERGDDHSPFISEKTFLHPLVNLQPFICVGNPNTIKTLNDLGFKTFHPLIDESYDSCTNFRERMQLIEREIKRLSEMSQQQLHDLYYALVDRLLHNQQHIMTFRNHDPFETTFDDIRNWYGSQK
jgi:hypothetical protein